MGKTPSMPSATCAHGAWSPAPSSMLLVLCLRTALSMYSLFCWWCSSIGPVGPCTSPSCTHPPLPPLHNLCCGCLHSNGAAAVLHQLQTLLHVSTPHHCCACTHVIAVTNQLEEAMLHVQNFVVPGVVLCHCILRLCQYTYVTPALSQVGCYGFQDPLVPGRNQCIPSFCVCGLTTTLTR